VRTMGRFLPSAARIPVLVSKSLGSPTMIAFTQGRRVPHAAACNTAALWVLSPCADGNPPAIVIQCGRERPPFAREWLRHRSNARKRASTPGNPENDGNDTSPTSSIGDSLDVTHWYIALSV